jgi:hypothetical protein
VTLTTNCGKTGVFDLDTKDLDGKLDMGHIAECPECAQLLDGHRKLAFAFQAVHRSTPSIHFNRDLKSRLIDEQENERRISRRILVLRAYWLLATLASFFTLWSIPWSPAATSKPVMVSVGIFIGLVAIVPAMIWRRWTFDRGLI